MDLSPFDPLWVVCVYRSIHRSLSFVDTRILVLRETGDSDTDYGENFLESKKVISLKVILLPTFL